LDKKPLFAFLAASAALLLTAPSANAQSLRELMEDIGVQKKEKVQIDYSERAPLVLPPSLDALPPPEDGNALAAANPNWPKDPDVAAALEEEEKQKIPSHLRSKYKENAAAEIYGILDKEREEGKAASAPREYETIFDRDRIMTPAELKQVRDKRAAEAANAPEQNVYVEPERKRLTDPPPGYRMPSAAQPYGPDAKDQKRKNGLFSKLNPFD
jgi:hypothetical protein